MKTVKDFLANDAHLPAPLRDFHDQKDVFKSLHRWIRKPTASGHVEDARLSWVDGHVYVIDFFLRFMAAHGYTLQRSRADVSFASLAATIKERRDEEAEEFRAFMASAHQTPPDAAPQSPSTVPLAGGA